MPSRHSREQSQESKNIVFAVAFCFSGGMGDVGVC